MAFDMEQRKREFEESAVPHFPALHNFALKMTRSRDKAEDIVQDTFFRAYRAYATFEPGTNMKAWLFQILRNVHINDYRRARRRSQDLAFEAIEGIAETSIETAARLDPEQIVMADDLDGEIRDALESLPDGFREVVILAFVEEKSYREIADALSIPIGTVMSRIHRGRRLLQTRLAGYGARRRLVA